MRRAARSPRPSVATRASPAWTTRPALWRSYRTSGRRRERRSSERGRMGCSSSSSRCRARTVASSTSCTTGPALAMRAARRRSRAAAASGRPAGRTGSPGRGWRSAMNGRGWAQHAAWRSSAASRSRPASAPSTSLRRSSCCERGGCRSCAYRSRRGARSWWPVARAACSSTTRTRRSPISGPTCRRPRWPRPARTSAVPISSRSRGRARSATWLR